MNFDPLRSLVILLHWLIVEGPHRKKVHPVHDTEYRVWFRVSIVAVQFTTPRQNSETQRKHTTNDNSDDNQNAFRRHGHESVRNGESIVRCPGLPQIDTTTHLTHT